MEFIAFLTLALVALAVWQIFSIRSTVESLRNDLEHIRERLAHLRNFATGQDAEKRSTAPAPLPIQYPSTAPIEQPLATPEKKEEPVYQPASAPVAEAETIILPPPLPLQWILNQSPPLQQPDVIQPSPPQPSQAESTPDEPRQPRGALAETLSLIWHWFLVGDEFRRGNGATEKAVAATWLMRLGIVFLVGVVAYFLSWSIEHGLVGPWGRVGISMFFGIGMLVSGLRLLDGRWRLLAHGFMGGGLAILYYSMYATGPMYHLISSAHLVFGLMALVTVAAGALSLRTGSMLVAILGIIGGFSTPILLSTGETNFPVLFSYILLLDLGILAIALHKQWRVLNYLGFFFTYVLFLLSMENYVTSTDFTIVIVFLSLFFCVQSAVIYLHNIRRNIRSTLLEILHLILNAAVYAILAYPLIKDAAGNPYPAILTFGLALFFMLHVLLFLQRRITDRPLLLTLIALAGFFATITLPIIMDKDALTISLSLEALMFLWLGGRLNCQFVRLLGQGLFFIVFFRLAIWDFGRSYAGYHTPGSMSIYWPAMLDRLWTFGIAIASVFGAFYFERRFEKDRLNIDAGVTQKGLQADNDIPALFKSNVAGEIFFWGLIVSLCIYLQCEFNVLLDFYRPLKPAALTAIWCAFALFFLMRFMSVRRYVMLGACLFFITIAAGKAALFDPSSWDLRESFVFEQVYAPLDSLMRWLDFGAVLAVCAMAWRTLRRSDDPVSPISSLFGYAGLVLLLFFATLESNTLLYWKLPVFQDGGLSMLWAIFAISFLAGGIGYEVKPLRYMGLGLFTIVVFKVFLVDLHAMPAIYRVLAFFVIGLCLLAGSYAYLRSGREGNENTKQK